jgi:hypothetical protein
MAKRIRVSADSGTSWFTLPGASGELGTEMANVDDTIFGQEFQSESPSIGTWNVTGAAYFKGVAGYSAAVKVGGTPTTTSGEATTQIGSTLSYQITAPARRVISLANPVVVNDDGTPVDTDDIESIDYLNGIVTFVSGYTVAGAVTVDCYYLPTAVIGKARSFTLTQTLAEIDTTDYATAQANGGWRTYIAGLKTVGLELGNVWDSANDFIAKLQARGIVYIDVSPDNTAGTASEVLYRGFFKYLQQGQQGNVGALEEETLNLNLYVPDGELIAAPFRWYFGAAHKLSPAVKICLDAWQAGTPIMVQYSPDGTNGKQGNAIVTEASLANVYEGQNEFSFTFMGTGTLADIT